MKPVAFGYRRPERLDSALTMLADSGQSLISGGQSLGPMLNLRLARPAGLVDLRRLPELREHRVEQGRLRLGAAITHAEIEDGLVPDTTRGMLAHVARSIAYRAVRNRGTIGGSLAHADPAADWINTLTGLGATVHLAGGAGPRTLPIENFVLGAYRTALAPGELVAAIELPAFSAQMRWGYYKICAKVGEFASAIGVAVIDPAQGFARLVMGAVEATPVLLAEPARWLSAPGADPRVLTEAFTPLVRQAFPGQDPVFAHHHAVALARAVVQSQASRP